ncbi:MAG: NfeD family protein [Ruminococcus sp.]|nr:NfeD family protein [Ruminococcus sp.]
MTIFWIIVLVACIVIELATLQFITIWFGLASVPALILAATGQPIWLQILVFFVAATVLVICTRPFVKKFQKNIVATNADLDVGKTAMVTETIDNSKNEGRVNLNGVFWAARSVDGTVIEKDTTVVVKEINGTKLIVSAESK